MLLVGDLQHGLPSPGGGTQVIKKIQELMSVVSDVHGRSKVS